MEEKKVLVTLKARCLVDGQVREAGEQVEVSEIANTGNVFGEPVKGVRSLKDELPKTGE